MPSQPSILPPENPQKRSLSGPRRIPILPVRDTVLFPHAVLPLTVGRESSIQLIESLGKNARLLLQPSSIRVLTRRSRPICTK